MYKQIYQGKVSKLSKNIKVQEINWREKRKEKKKKNEKKEHYI